MASKSGFSNRVRFNWGFHDATHAVAQGWADGGFAAPLAKGRTMTPEIVLAEHFDSAYARGWAMGYAAMAGRDRADRPASSEPAWQEALGAGLVAV